MDNAELFTLLTDQVLVLGISLTRIAVAYLILPIFSGQLIPPLVRNSIFVSLGLITLLINPVDALPDASTAHWIQVFASEVFIGLAIGVFFGIFLWAFEAAGILIDSAVGSTIGQVYDPVSGHEVTLYGEFLGRWANFLFMASGGLLLLTGAVLQSYAMWPIGVPLADLRTASITLFETEFSRFLTLTVMLASPLLLVTFLVDISMGLINRFAPQLNVLFLSMSIKGFAAALILMLMLSTLTGIFVTELQTNSSEVLEAVKRLFAT